MFFHFLGIRVGVGIGYEEVVEMELRDFSMMTEYVAGYIYS